MKKVFFFSILFLVILTGCKSREEGIQHLNKGMSFYNNGRYDEAIDEFKEACYNDIAEGCYDGGLVLETKKVNFFTKSYYGPDIYKAYQRGCELGSQKSCTKAEKWKEYKNGSIFTWIGGFIGLIIIVALIWFLIVDSIRSISRRSRRSRRSGGSESRDYSNEAEIFSGMADDFFNKHF